MHIPFLDLKKQYESYENEIKNMLDGFLRDQKFVLGEKVVQFEKKVADYCGTSFGVGVSSGSDALIISLMALNIGKDDYVITTPFTFFATAGAIARLGAIPIFCDIDPVTYNISVSDLQALLKDEIEDKGNQRIKAVIPVHLYGQCVDMNGVMELAAKYNFSVIEDAAQAIGTDFPSVGGTKRACALGTMGTLSFFPSKNLGAFGDGGMVLTNDEALAARLKLLRGHGSTNKYFYDTIGGNFRIDALQAAILEIKLNYLDLWIAGRKAKAETYDRLFRESGLVEQKKIGYPATVYRQPDVPNFHTYHQYVLRAERRDELQQHLKEKGVASAIYYPLSLHLQKCFSYLGYKLGDFPESEKATKEVLAIPIFPELTDEQQDYVVESIKAFY